MTNGRLRISSIARRLIVIAYRDHPDLQSIPYEEFKASAKAHTLEDFRLKTPKSLITIHTGGTKFSMECRIHGGRDIFGGATVITPAAIGQGHIQIMDEAIILPEGRLPAALVTRTAGRLSNKERIALGEVLSLDERIGTTPITHISRGRNNIRIGIDTIWMAWNSVENNTITEIEAP